MEVELRPFDIIAFSGNGRKLGVVFELNRERVDVLPIDDVTNIAGRADVLFSSADCVPGGGPDLRGLIRLDQPCTMSLTDVVSRVGTLGKSAIDKVLRAMTARLIEKHYEFVQRNKGPFVAGETPVPYAGRVFDADEMKMLGEASLDFWLTAGRFARQFEKAFGELLGVRHCMLVNSGSSANLLAVSALTSPLLKDRRLRPGDEVLTVAAGFPTTVAPIAQNRLVPVFLDIDLGTYNVNVDQLEQAISPRTKAIFLAHTLGNPFNLERVCALARKHGLWLIEDNCDALGSVYKGKLTGTFGDIATFSFYPPHHMTMGEGGAVATSDPVLKKALLSFRDWGRDCVCDPGQDNACGKRFSMQLGKLPLGYDHKYTYSHLGYNLKVTDMQAAVGLAQLKKLPGFIKARRENWTRLRKALSSLGEVLVLPQAEEHSEPSWFGFLLTVRDSASFERSELVRFLEAKRITTRMLFAGNIVRQPCMEGVECRVPFALNNTDIVMNRTFWVGVYPGLTAEMIDFMAEQINAFIKSR